MSDGKNNINIGVFSTLNSVNVSMHTEKKKNLTYLSWAWAWGKLKEYYPESTYKVYETSDGCIYWHDGKTAWVKTGVTVQGLEHIEYLPVLDYRNTPILIGDITSFHVNTAIQRSITKAIARHGLGLYIYAGEDFPENLEVTSLPEKNQEKDLTKPFISPEQLEKAIEWIKRGPGTRKNLEKKYQLNPEDYARLDREGI